MTPTSFRTFAAFAVVMMVIGAGPLAAQSGSSNASARPPAQASTIQPRPPQPQGQVYTAYPNTVYVVPVQPRDTRTQKERCLDDEIAREGGLPSRLAMASIDLKCSQR